VGRQLFGNRPLFLEVGSRLFLVVEHGHDLVRWSSLGCRCRLWRSAERGATLSWQEEEEEEEEEEGLCLAADLHGNHPGRHRDKEADFACRGQPVEAALVEG
jgi:hypothetical protein